MQSEIFASYPDALTLPLGKNIAILQRRLQHTVANTVTRPWDPPDQEYFRSAEKSSTV